MIKINRSFAVFLITATSSLHCSEQHGSHAAPHNGRTFRTPLQTIWENQLRTAHNAHQQSSQPSNSIEDMVRKLDSFQPSDLRKSDDIINDQFFANTHVSGGHSDSWSFNTADPSWQGALAGLQSCDGAHSKAISAATTNAPSKTITHEKQPHAAPQPQITTQNAQFHALRRQQSAVPSLSRTASIKSGIASMAEERDTAGSHPKKAKHEHSLTVNSQSNIQALAAAANAAKTATAMLAAAQTITATLQPTRAQTMEVEPNKSIPAARPRTLDEFNAKFPSSQPGHQSSSRVNNSVDQQANLPAASSSAFSAFKPRTISNGSNQVPQIQRVTPHMNIKLNQLPVSSQPPAIGAAIAAPKVSPVAFEPYKIPIEKQECNFDVRTGILSIYKINTAGQRELKEQKKVSKEKAEERQLFIRDLNDALDKFPAWINDPKSATTHRTVKQYQEEKNPEKKVEFYNRELLLVYLSPDSHFEPDICSEEELKKLMAYMGIR